MPCQQFPSERRQHLESAFRVAVLHDEILPLDIAEIVHPAHEGCEETNAGSCGATRELTQPIHLPDLLRPRRERPRRRAAKQRDEISASHVGHGPLLALWRRPMRSVYHTPSLPRTWRQDMGQT